MVLRALLCLLLLAFPLPSGSGSCQGAAKGFSVMVKWIRRFLLPSEPVQDAMLLSWGSRRGTAPDGQHFHTCCIMSRALRDWTERSHPLLDHWHLFGVQPCLSFLGRSMGLIICCVWVSFQVCLRQAVFCLWEEIRKVLGSASGLSLYSREENPLFFCLNYICLFKFLVVNIIPQWKSLFFSPVKPYYQLLVCPIKLICIYNKNSTRYINVLVHTSLLWQLLPSKANDLMSSGEVTLQWYCICINLFLIHFTVQK